MAAGRGLAAAVEPFTSAGQQAIADRIIGGFAKGGPMTIQNNRLANVPGSVPTLAEATQNPGLASLQRGAESVRPNPFEARKIERGAAREDLTSSLKGDQASLENLIADRQAATDPLREAAFANAGKADATNVVQKIDEILKGPEGQRDAGALLATRNAIDGLMANEQNPQVIRQLTMARRDVDAELGRAVPGIKDVDAKFQELARQSEALQAGGQALDSGKTAVRPQEFAQNFTQGANPAGTLVGPSAVPIRTQQGMAGEVHRLVGTKGNDLVALRNVLQGEGGWNTAKLTQAFGEENTNRLIGGVTREGAFDATTNELVKNSATARRQAAEELLKESEPGSLNLLPASIQGAAMQAGKKVLFDPLVQLLTNSPSAPRNLELARMMMSQGATRDQILEQLLRLNARQQMVSNTGNLLAGVLGGGTNRLLSGAAMTDRP
jgi:hypothetical protein